MTQNGLSAGARIQDVALRRHGGLTGSGSLAGMLVFCLLWNAIAYGIATAVWFLNPDDAPPLFAKAILVLFMGIGLVLVGVVVKMILARMKLFPPELHVSVQPLRLGEAFEIRFRQRVKTPVHIERVSVKFICRESATYRRGTDTTTVTHEVFKEEREFAHDSAADSVHPVEAEASFRIPEDGMHSFQANRNRIDWLMEVRTAVADWPDYSETFELQVAPERTPAGEAS